VRGKPSSRNPSEQSGRLIRSRIIFTITSSGTSSPRFMKGARLHPERSAALDVVAEDVTGRDLRYAELLR